jgi:hypothetical protein
MRKAHFPQHLLHFLRGEAAREHPAREGEDSENLTRSNKYYALEHFKRRIVRSQVEILRF